jgi:hypothetical protein
MKEKVVYLLGAGFSAPLGLPVMSNFYFKSRDQYFESPEKYSYFMDVFEIIRKLGDVKNYFRADLFNIEEILSILEMQRHLGRGESKGHDYIKYLCDVVEYYTPTFKAGNLDQWGWYNHLVESRKAKCFGEFVACLFNLTANWDRSLQRPFASRAANPQTMYSVVTLNYDLVLESLCKHISSVLGLNIAFRTDPKEVNDEWPGAPYLSKLHGTVESGNVIPPTWNKALHPEIQNIWQLAYKLISTATQIRVVGYSLPETDSYVKYLLKSAIVEARNLKQVDVICLDPKGDVRVRYDEFIDFPNYRFAPEDVSSYLSHDWPAKGIDPVKYDFLEAHHLRVKWSSHPVH